MEGKKKSFALAAVPKRAPLKERWTHFEHAPIHALIMEDDFPVVV